MGGGWGNPSLEFLFFWDEVVSRVSRWLDLWKGGLFSIVVELLLFLSSFPLYFLSLFRIPKRAVARIETIIRDLLWSNTRGH